MFDLGVANYQLHLLRHRHMLEFERAAIEQQCVSGFAQAGYKLVHNADACSDKFVFCSLTEFRDFRQRKFFVGQTQESQSCGDFYCRRRTQAGSDRHLAVHKKVGARQMMTGLSEHGCYPQHIVTPSAERLLRQMQDVELEDFLKLGSRSALAEIAAWVENSIAHGRTKPSL